MTPWGSLGRLMASTGLGAARFLSTPDSIAISGVLGGGLFFGLDQGALGSGRTALGCVCPVPGRGFLLSGLIGLILLLHRRWGPSSALGGDRSRRLGTLAAALLACGGPSLVDLAPAVAVQLDYGAWVRGEPSLGWTGERVSFVLQAFPGAVFTVLLASAVFLIPLALLRKQGQLPAAQVLWLGLFLMPPAVLVLAPALRPAEVFSDLQQSLCPCLLRWLAEAWNMPPLGALRGAAIPRLCGGLGPDGGGIDLGWRWVGTLQAKPSRELTCPHGPGPYLASDPLSLSDRCAVQAHLLPRGVSEQEIRNTWINTRFRVPFSMPVTAWVWVQKRGACSWAGRPIRRAFSVRSDTMSAPWFGSLRS